MTDCRAAPPDAAAQATAIGMAGKAPPEVAALAARSVVLATPCGAGSMVWRVWRGSAKGAAPLVLLHGGSGSWTHWVRNIDALVSSGRTVWVPDLPGFGDSAVPPCGSDADALVQPLAEGMRALWGDAPCDLVGFSFGGLVAGLLLQAEPALARRLVLVGAPAMGVVPRQLFTLQAWRHLPTPQAQRTVHRHNLAELMLSDPALIEGLALQVHVANVARDRMPRRRLAHTDALARALPGVRCPVHAVYGAHDALYKGWIAALEGAFRAAAPDFRGLALVPRAGHWVQFEQPGAFGEALRAALAHGA
ncbi:Alpha-beta hydrolase superfamily lysophospholipase [Paracidovorax anthurii]|uniref:Alpha-beta hydrolase superfamily lysophospholipase n=2 Tax=Paracidovorax anthurii TaxID=78229 RepID=A0A328ZME0_9BURK|nr:alpha-beta hydrolase superfamily lysophospholipase [Paracidovorax anthurii]